MGVGEIIDRAIRLYRQHWKTFLTIVAWPLVPFALIRALSLQGLRSTVPSFDPVARPTVGSAFASAVPARYIGLTVLFLAIEYLLVRPLITAAVSRAAADSYLGRDLSVRGVYRAAFSKLWAVLLVLTLVLLIEIGGFFLLIIPLFILHIRLIVSPVAVMLEGAKGRGAVRRSWRLTRGNFWKTVGLLLLAGLLGSVASGIFTLTSVLVGSHLGPASWIVNGLLAAAALVIVTPFTTIVLVLLYFDLRIRKEAFDLSMLAQQIQLAAPQ